MKSIVDYPASPAQAPSEAPPAGGDDDPPPKSKTKEPKPPTPDPEFLAWLDELL